MMLSNIRKKFGPVVITGIVGLITFVFVFFGVFSPKATRGLHEGAVAGTVNGESISLSEFNREYQQRMEFFRQMAGGKISEEQLKVFRFKESVFQEIVQRKVILQEAYRQGRFPSDEEVRERIASIEAFHKEGRFDPRTYKEVLQANRLTPAGFEKKVREDLMVQAVTQVVRGRLPVTEQEIQEAQKKDPKQQQLAQQLEQRKERRVLELWIKSLTDKAKIEKNKEVLAEESAES